MTGSPFFPDYEELPNTLPVFPLANVIVMPGTQLPLNIFEPRYLNMVEDALKTHHMIGMIQPAPAKVAKVPATLCHTGCAGRITSYSETDDGRILLSLTGLIRFRIQQELPGIRGYRVIIPEWQEFADDLELEHSGILDRRLFAGVLRRYLQEKNLEVDWQVLEHMPDMSLVHMLATLLPLDGADKQLILETLDPRQRADALLASLDISTQQGADPTRH